jgi:NAD(P)-dependent dehydrogenase (short-subunit alcohol dehydrogenase family)
MGLLDGRVVIVTGAGRGLGREHCLELAHQGASVVVNDLGVGLHGQDDPERSPAEKVVDEILASGGVAIADGASVTDFAATAATVERTVETYGRLDAVVNNAGIVRDRMITGMTEEDFDLVVAVHLKGTWNLSRHGAGRVGPGPELAEECQRQAHPQGSPANPLEPLPPPESGGSLLQEGG